jgi:hypothetical protein
LITVHRYLIFLTPSMPSSLIVNIVSSLIILLNHTMCPFVQCHRQFMRMIWLFGITSCPSTSA